MQHRTVHPSFHLPLVQHFSPNLYAITMGTGILALMMGKLPWEAAFKTGELLWMLNALLFCGFSVLFGLKALLYPTETRQVLDHPTQSLFLGAVPMGLATVINGLLEYGLPLWGSRVVPFAQHLWMLDAVLALITCTLVPYRMFTRSQHPLKEMTALWLLPVVAPEVTAASAGLLIPHLSQHAWGMLCTSYVLWAFSVPLALMLLTVLVLRLTQHQLPGREMALSMFLPIGPLATAALALLQLGGAAGPVLAAQNLPSLTPVLQGIGLVGGLVLWGFACWWLVLALLTTCRYLKTGLPFNLGWWGLTFPVGVFSAATFALADVTHLTLLRHMATALVGVLVLLWMLVTLRTLQHQMQPSNT
ncbi:TDT family transporter [Deinococcus roseus]|nr:TDT family transporter [Deinococcus roseus]